MGLEPRSKQVSLFTLQAIYNFFKYMDLGKCRMYAKFTNYVQLKREEREVHFKVVRIYPLKNNYIT